MIRNSEMCTGSELMCLKKKKELTVDFYVIKVPLLEHMLAQTNIVARHNLPIRRKLLDVKATCPTGSDRTGLKGT